MRTGRPKTDNPRTFSIHLRLTYVEFAALSVEAGAAHVSLSEWIRRKALRSPRKKRPA